MKVILDVSAAFSVIMASHSSKLFLPSLESAEEVIAPELFIAEATNTAWKFNYARNASPDESWKLTLRCIQLVDIFIPLQELWPVTLAMACQVGHPTYDCFYLILCRQESAMLLTADKKLIKVAKKLKIQTPDIKKDFI